MTFSVLLQVLFDLIMLAGVAFLWVKLHRPQKDDPRLSRGLQLLQSKIAVLEDLSDQVETQVQQVTALIEAKGKEVRSQIVAAEKQIQKIESSMGKSLEVAKIFQDRIPHQEIIERQNTMKYVKAARLAHQGASVEEIVEQVDLSRGEIEFIAKVNRETLQFSEEDLPEWVKDPNTEVDAVKVNAPQAIEPQALARHQDTQVSLSDLGERFRQALPNEAKDFTISSAAQAPKVEMPNKVATPAPAKEMGKTPSGKSVEIQKVVFPRVDLTRHLG